MKSIIFNELELTELKNFFEHQIQRMQERIQNIQNILNKVTDEAFAAADAMISATGIERYKKLTPEEILEKSGLRATKWNKFIIGALQKLNRPLTIIELAEMAAKEFGYSKNELEKLRLTINQALIRIRKSNAVKEYKIKGLKNKYFGLEAWFNGNALLDDFQNFLGASGKDTKKSRKSATGSKISKGKSSKANTKKSVSARTRRVSSPRRKKEVSRNAQVSVVNKKESKKTEKRKRTSTSGREVTSEAQGAESVDMQTNVG